MNQPPVELYEVRVVDNSQMLHVQNVVNVMKGLTYEVDNIMKQYVFMIPYCSGKNCGYHLCGNDGRAVNLISEHVANDLVAFFGEVMDFHPEFCYVTKENPVTAHYSKDYTKAANEIMEYLVNGTLPAGRHLFIPPGYKP